MIVRSHGSGRPARVSHAPPNVESTSFTIHGDPEVHTAAAYSGERAVGFMDYDPGNKTIGSVYVSPQFRGHQAATRMYFAAGKPGLSSDVTEEGEGLMRSLAKKTGREMPTPSPREPLSESGYEEILPFMAGEHRGEATRTRRYASIRRQQ